MTETQPLDTATMHSADCPYRDDRGMTVREYRDHIKNTECKPPERTNWLNSGSLGSMLKGRGLVAERLGRLKSPPIDYLFVARPQPQEVRVINQPPIQAVQEINPTQPEGGKSRLWWLIVGATVSAAISIPVAATVSILLTRFVGG